MKRIERPLSLVAQVEQALRQAISDSLYTDGRLPSEIELAEQLGVSRETVRRAADILEQEGLLVKHRRRGTFIKPANTAIGFLVADNLLANGIETNASAHTYGDVGKVQDGSGAVSGLGVATRTASRADSIGEIDELFRFRHCRHPRPVSSCIVLLKYSSNETLSKSLANNLENVEYME